MTTKTETKEISRKVEFESTFEQMYARSQILIKSKLLPQEVKSAEDALIIMQIGKELGIEMMKSFRSIYVVHGRPSLSAQLMKALCDNSDKCERFDIAESTDKRCKIIVQRKARQPREVLFTWEMASKMQTKEWVNGVSKTVALTEKYNWKTMPEIMLLWRAISLAARTEFPELVLGLYTPEELEAEVDFSENPVTKKLEVKEVREIHKEESVETKTKPVEDASDLGPDDIPEDQLVNWVMPSGKYAGKRLGEIIEEINPTGKNKGIDYLEWLVKEAKDRKQARIIERFLEVLNRS